MLFVSRRSRGLNQFIGGFVLVSFGTIRQKTKGKNLLEAISLDSSNAVLA
jgi:hypothetical protein